MAADTVNPDVARDKRFYVYVYRDPRPGRSMRPIYVGKGTASLGRAELHWLRGSKNRMFAAVLSKIRKAALSPVIEIVGRFDDEAEAFDLERTLIAEYGRRDLKVGPLVNLTDGGDGTTGHLPSIKARRASSARLKKIRAAQWDDISFRTTAIANLDAARKMMWSGPERRSRQTAFIREAKAALAADPARSSKQSEQRSVLRREAWRNPETRAAYTAASRAAKEAKSAKMKALWDDPEYRSNHGAKVSAAAKAAWADPETRQRRTDAIRAGRRRAKAAEAEADVSG